MQLLACSRWSLKYALFSVCHYVFGLRKLCHQQCSQKLRIQPIPWAHACSWLQYLVGLLELCFLYLSWRTPSTARFVRLPHLTWLIKLNSSLVETAKLGYVQWGKHPKYGGGVPRTGLRSTALGTTLMFGLLLGRTSRSRSENGSKTNRIWRSSQP